MFLSRNREQRVKTWTGFRTLLIGELTVPEAVAICRRLIDEAVAGKSWAINQLFDRTDGKATTIVDMTTRKERSMAIDALKQLPREAALQQIEAAAEQLALLKRELLTTTLSLERAEGEREKGARAQGERDGEGLAPGCAVSDNVPRETCGSETPQDVVVADGDNLELEINPIESTDAS